MGDTTSINFLELKKVMQVRIWMMGDAPSINFLSVSKNSSRWNLNDGRRSLNLLFLRGSLIRTFQISHLYWTGNKLMKFRTERRTDGPTGRRYSVYACMVASTYKFPHYCRCLRRITSTRWRTKATWKREFGSPTKNCDAVIRKLDCKWDSTQKWLDNLYN